MVCGIPVAGDKIKGSYDSYVKERYLETCTETTETSDREPRGEWPPSFHLGFGQADMVERVFQAKRNGGGG